MRTGLIVGAIAMLLAAVVVILFGESEPKAPTTSAESAPPPQAEAPVASPAPAAAVPAPVVAVRDTGPMESGGRRTIGMSSLSSSEPLVVDLRIGAPESDVEFLSARILTKDRAPLDLTGSVSPESGGVVRAEIEAGWLLPGRYVIEVKTNESSHFPVHRYVLAVN